MKPSSLQNTTPPLRTAVSDMRLIGNTTNKITFGKFKSNVYNIYLTCLYSIHSELRRCIFKPSPSMRSLVLHVQLLCIWHVVTSKSSFLSCIRQLAHTRGPQGPRKVQSLNSPFAGQQPTDCQRPTHHLEVHHPDPAPSPRFSRESLPSTTLET